MTALLLDLLVASALLSLAATLVETALRAYRRGRTELDRRRAALGHRIRAAVAGSAALILTLVACDAAAPNPPVAPLAHVTASDDGAVGEVHLRTADPNAQTVGPEQPGQPFSYKIRKIAEAGTNALTDGGSRPGQMATNGLHLKIEDSEARTVSISAPIILLDGVEVAKVVLQRLDKARIASVAVLKGEAAVAAYGEAGRGGVIQITTKP